MTVLFSFSRTATRHWGARPVQLLTRLNASTPLLRASYYTNDDSKTYLWPCKNQLKTYNHFTTREFATDAPKTRGRPKAHTGRTTAKTASGAKSKSVVAKKPSAKKTKAKAKPKSKPKKRVLSEAGLKRKAIRDQRLKVTELKSQALLDAPKKLPESVWAVFFSEKSTRSGRISDTVTENTKAVAKEYRSLSSSERERLNQTANGNKSKNDSAYKKWVSSYQPLEVKKANEARKQLAKLRKSKSGTIAAAATKPIHDDRLVKQPRNSRIWFSSDRYASGDLKSITITEAAKLITREWNALSASEKQKYQDKAEADRQRYIEEYTSVYGVAPKLPKS